MAQHRLGFKPLASPSRVLLYHSDQSPAQGFSSQCVLMFGTSEELNTHFLSHEQMDRWKLIVANKEEVYPISPPITTAITKQPHTQASGPVDFAPLERICQKQLLILYKAWSSLLMEETPRLLLKYQSFYSVARVMLLRLGTWRRQPTQTQSRGVQNSESLQKMVGAQGIWRWVIMINPRSQGTACTALLLAGWYFKP